MRDLTEAIAYMLIGAIFAVSVVGLDNDYQHNTCAKFYSEPKNESKQGLTTPPPTANGRVLETSIVDGPWENQ